MQRGTLFSLTCNYRGGLHAEVWSLSGDMKDSKKQLIQVGKHVTTLGGGIGTEVRVFR